MVCDHKALILGKEFEFKKTKKITNLGGLESFLQALQDFVGVVETDLGLVCQVVHFEEPVLHHLALLLVLKHFGLKVQMIPLTFT